MPEASGVAVAFERATIFELALNIAFAAAAVIVPETFGATVTHMYSRLSSERLCWSIMSLL